MDDAKTLFETNVGSHMWGMERPDSDIDIYRAYIAPTRDILIGNARQNSHESQSKEVDRSSHEIGVVVKQLLKGNVNHLWGVMSPIIIMPSTHIYKLREFVKKSISKNCFHSINGISYANYQKYIIARKMEPELYEKKCNLIVRTLRFGIQLLRGEGFHFDAVEDMTELNIQTYTTQLEKAHAESPLPDKAPNEQEFYDWLYRLRIDELNGEI